MEPTLIGLVQLLIGGCIVVAGRLRAAFLFLMLSGLFSGSAALLLPALGGSSIAPPLFALLFFYLRVMAPRGGFTGYLPDAIRANRWLVFFVIYGMAAALIGPRLFSGAMEVYPMRYTLGRALLDTVPLVPTPQNITAAFFLSGTLLMAVAGYVTCRARGGAATLVSAAITIAWAHIALGLLAMLARGTSADAIFDALRNGAYTQMDDDFAGFVRIRGTFPEASAYAEFGFAFFALNAELWYHAIRPRATGTAALALAAVLFMSTSSTAYVSLAAYLAFLLLRVLAFPNLLDPGKARALVLLFCALGVALAVLVALVPDTCRGVLDMMLRMTVEKPSSSSGQQRLFWAQQSWDAFLASHGLGIGPGSLRSSSLFLAILGSSGVIGIGTFLLYLGGVLQPGRGSTWGASRGTAGQGRGGSDLALSLGGALATAALLSLIPEAVSGTNAYPNAIFAVLAGGALALRPLGQGREAQTPARA